MARFKDTRKKFKESCKGCKHEIKCWTAYHDGIDCYEENE